MGEIADYQRNLAGSTAASGAKFADVFSEVALVEDTFSAAQFFAAGKDVFRSPRFQRQFAREIIRAVSRRARVRSRDIRFGSVRSLHVGDESILQPVSVRVHGVRSSGDRISLRVDCAVGGLELWGVPGGRISFGEASGLAGKMADRMRTGFSVAPMIFVAPTIGVLPKVTGKKIIEEMAAQGQTLIITGNGTWSNCPTGFTYQWERCDAAGANCAAVGAAFGDAVAEVSRQFYTLTAADVGARVRVSVTAMNAAGPSKAATSTPTVVIR